GDGAVGMLDRAGDEQAARARAAAAAGRGCAGRDGDSAGRDGNGDKRDESERHLNELDLEKRGDLHRLSFLLRGRQRSPLLRSPLLVCTAAQVLGLAGTPGRGEAAPPGANKRTGRARQAGAFAAAWRQASRGPERLRGHSWRTSPAVLVHSQRRT